MPNTKSGVKRLRQSAERNKANVRRKNRIRSARKKFMALTEAGEVAAAQEALDKVYAALDHASKHHTISANKAARLKSRLTRKLNSAQPTP